MADNQSLSRPKRRLRNDGETVRERAEKAQAEAQKTPKPSLGRRLVRQLMRPLRSLAKIFHYQPFPFIGRGLRLVGRIVAPKYLRNSWRELRLVRWPNRPETRRLTFAVIVFATAFGGLVAAVDYGLDKLFREVLLK